MNSSYILHVHTYKLLIGTWYTYMYIHINCWSGRDTCTCIYNFTRSWGKKNKKCKRGLNINAYIYIYINYKLKTHCIPQITLCCPRRRESRCEFPFSWFTDDNFKKTIRNNERKHCVASYPIIIFLSVWLELFIFIFIDNKVVWIFRE